MELRPRMLKECLLEDSNSCSSNGFKSFPRRPPLDPFPKRKKKQSNALKAVINAVKNLRSNTVPSRILLPRSLSKPRISSSSSSNKNKVEDIITVVRVKDIVRWNSSKDLHEEKEDISHFKQSQTNQYITKTTTTTGSSSTSSSSWCDLDFTSEFLQSSSLGSTNVEEEACKKNLLCVSEDSCTAITVADTEEDLQSDKEQNSPVSVFEIQHEEDDETSNSSFSQCLDNVERTKEKLMQTIQRFENLANLSPFDEWGSMDEEDSCTEGDCDVVVVDIESKDEEDVADEVEKKAVKLWNQVKEKHSIWIHEEHLIMDYFRDELMNSFHENYNRDHQQDFDEEQLVGEAKRWLQGHRASLELETGSGEQRRQACAIEIERRDWNDKRMKEEREEVVVQMEDGIFSMLMNETLTEIY